MTTATDHATAYHPAPPLRTYFIVFAALLGLLFLTVGLAFLPARGGWRDLLTSVGFLIAGTKAILIILWFMHVKDAPRLVLIFALAGFAWLGIMFSLGMMDFGTRGLSREEGKPSPRGDS